MSDYYEHIGIVPRGARAALRAYMLGFALSLVLTLTPFVLIEIHIGSGHTAFSRPFLIASAIACALAQFAVQLVCFLHVNESKRGRPELLVFAFAAVIVGILVAGSLWIMNNLNERMMAPGQMEQYMQQEDAF